MRTHTNTHIIYLFFSFMVKSLVLYCLLLLHTVMHTRLIDNFRVTNYECRSFLASLCRRVEKKLLVHSVFSKWMNKLVPFCYVPLVILTISWTWRVSLFQTWCLVKCYKKMYSYSFKLFLLTTLIKNKIFKWQLSYKDDPCQDMQTWSLHGLLLVTFFFFC